MRSVLVLTFAAALALAHPGPPGPPTALGPGKSPGLSKDDADYLDGLLRDFLFDPKGATRVRVTVPVLDPPYPDRPAPTEVRGGWLVPGHPARVHFADGGSIPAPPPARMRPVPFVALCRWR